jgi:uncharacterized protein (DUF1786 family)
MIDIGAGTMDILYYNSRTDLHYKAVVKSPVRYMAEKTAGIPGNLLVVGNEMGGGPITRVLLERTKKAEVVMSRSSSAIEQIVKSFGVPYGFDAVAICAQDHGVPDPGISHLDFRHNMFTACLTQKPYPHTLLYQSDQVPDAMNRLKSIAGSAEQLPAAEVYVMDSGMAAILGASLDGKCRQKKRFLVLDIATSHTVGAAMAGEEIAGFFEYHTQDITLEKLEDLLRDLANGKLSHQQILSEGGHGAFLRQAVGFSAIETIVATGPKRKLLAQSKLPIEFGAPWGDNMMTGTVGLLEALRRHKGLAPVTYL